MINSGNKDQIKIKYSSKFEEEKKQIEIFSGSDDEPPKSKPRKVQKKVTTLKYTTMPTKNRDGSEDKNVRLGDNLQKPTKTRTRQNSGQWPSTPLIQKPVNKRNQNDQNELKKQYQEQKKLQEQGHFNKEGNKNQYNWLRAPWKQRSKSQMKETLKMEAVHKHGESHVDSKSLSGETMEQKDLLKLSNKEDLGSSHSKEFWGAALGAISDEDRRNSRSSDDFWLEPRKSDSLSKLMTEEQKNEIEMKSPQRIVLDEISIKLSEQSKPAQKIKIQVQQQNQQNKTILNPQPIQMQMGGSNNYNKQDPEMQQQKPKEQPMVQPMEESDPQSEEQEDNSAPNEAEDTEGLQYFNILVCGQVGIGKTGFISLFMDSLEGENYFKSVKSKGKQEQEDPSQSAIYYTGSENKATQGWPEQTKSAGAVQLKMIDSPGYGDKQDLPEWRASVEGHIVDRIEDYRKKEDDINNAASDGNDGGNDQDQYKKLEKIEDRRIHLLLFLFDSHPVKQQDLISLQAFQKYTNVLPLVAKSDQYVGDQLEQFKKQIMKQAQEARPPVEFYDFKKLYRKLSEDDQKKMEEEGLLSDTLPPFAVCAPSHLKEIKAGGRWKVGRRYRWGWCDALDADSTDLSKLQKLVLRYLRSELVDVTKTIYKEYVKEHNEEGASLESEAACTQEPGNLTAYMSIGFGVVAILGSFIIFNKTK